MGTAFRVRGNPAQFRQVGTAIETDSALTVSSTQNPEFVVATELDSGLAIARRKIAGIQFPTETDSGLVIPRRVPIGVASEQDVALSIGGQYLVEPAFRALKLLRPMAVGSVGTGLHSADRIFYAYPGLDYNIRAAVVGGSYPYFFELENAPPGMTVHARTGEINMPGASVTASFGPVTLHVTDSLGSSVQGTWSVTVGTAGWHFVAGDFGGTSDGSIGNPWKTPLELLNNSSGGERAYWYQATADYLLAATTSPSERHTWMAFGDSAQIWIAVPGHSPVINQNYQDDSVDVPIVEFCGLSSGAPAYVDGFEFKQARDKNIMMGTSTLYGYVLRRSYLHQIMDGLNGANSAHVMKRSTTGIGNNMYGWVAQDNEFSDIVGNPGSPGSCVLKLYSLDEGLVEDNYIHDVMSPDNSEGAIASKASAGWITVRGNFATNMHMPLYGGNHNIQAGETDQYSKGEICYNFVRGGSDASGGGGWGEENMAIFFQRFSDPFAMTAVPRGPYYVYRNSFDEGRVVLLDISSSDIGTWVFRHNAKVNSEDAGQTPWPYYKDLSQYAWLPIDATKIDLQEEDLNSSVADMFEANGDFTSAYAAHLGRRGHHKVWLT